MEYPARLSYLHLQSLERRLTADLILTYRIIFVLVDVCMSDYFQLMSADGDRTVTVPVVTPSSYQLTTAHEHAEKLF